MTRVNRAYTRHVMKSELTHFSRSRFVFPGSMTPSVARSGSGRITAPFPFLGEKATPTVRILPDLRRPADQKVRISSTAMLSVRLEKRLDSVEDLAFGALAVCGLATVLFAI